jgi:hypothetical protein
MPVYTFVSPVDYKCAETWSGRPSFVHILSQRGRPVGSGIFV